MFSYIISGLSVVSDLALPGLIALPDRPETPDVLLHAGTVPAEMADAAEGRPELADRTRPVHDDGAGRGAHADHRRARHDV